jgi:hypothetical protein
MTKNKTRKLSKQNKVHYSNLNYTQLQTEMNFIYIKTLATASSHLNLSAVHEWIHYTFAAWAIISAQIGNEPLPLVPILSQINSAHIFPSYFSKIHYNITLPPMPRFSKWTHTFRFPNKSISFISHLSHESYMPYLILLDLITLIFDKKVKGKVVSVYLNTMPWKHILMLN